MLGGINCHMKSKFIFIIIAACSVISGCWRMADPGGCSDWELFDYNSSTRFESNQCLNGKLCYIYLIEVCPSTLNLGFNDFRKNRYSTQFQNELRTKIKNLVESTGEILSGCYLNPNIPLKELDYGVYKITAPLLCDNQVIFPEPEAGDRRPYPVLYFQVP